MPPIAYTSDSAFVAAMRPVVRVVHDRREEVGGDDEGPFVAQRYTAASSAVAQPTRTSAGASGSVNVPAPR